MPDYKTNAQELVAAFAKDPEKASSLLLDIADELVNTGVAEPVEDAVTEALKPYLAQVLTSIQAKAGIWAKFFGDLADDPNAAVTFMLAEGDELVNAGAMEQLMDTVLALAKPYLVEALTAQQAKLAAVEIVAED